MQNFNVILMVIFVLLYMLLLLHNLHFIHKKLAMKIKIDLYLACIHPYEHVFTFYRLTLNSI